MRRRRKGVIGSYSDYSAYSNYSAYPRCLPSPQEKSQKGLPARYFLVNLQRLTINSAMEESKPKKIAKIAAKAVIDCALMFIYMKTLFIITDKLTRYFFDWPFDVSNSNWG